jgi:Fe-S-cluster containining protein
MPHDITVRYGRNSTNALATRVHETANAPIESPMSSFPDDPTPSPETLDCLECGACCFQRPGTILVTEEDIQRWTDDERRDILEQLEEGHFGAMAFRMNERGCCWFHGTEAHPHACAIYEDRATVCREFTAGCAQCREFRRDRGIVERP